MPTALNRTKARELAKRLRRVAEDRRAQFTARAYDLPVRLEQTK